MHSLTPAPVPPLAQWERYDNWRRSVGVNVGGYWYNVCYRHRLDSRSAPAVYVVYGPTGTDYGDGVHYMDLDGNPCDKPVDHTTAARARQAVVKHQGARA